VGQKTLEEMMVNLVPIENTAAQQELRELAAQLSAVDFATARAFNLTDESKQIVRLFMQLMNRLGAYEYHGSFIATASWGESSSGEDDEEFDLS
jgi:hypothetical protein